MILPPRPYQEEAVEAVWREIIIGDRHSTLLVMATGTGKTVVFAHLARLFLAFRPKARVLILAHRDELVWQAVNKCRVVMPEEDIEVEQGERFATARGHRDLFGNEAGRVVVASKDTLCRAKRLRRFRCDDFDLIIVDEAHHDVLRNKTYRVIREQFSKAAVLGVTATPDRGDGVRLGRNYESVAYVYDVLQAINDGYLVPLVQRLLTVNEYDLSQIRTVRNEDGENDFCEADVEKMMRSNEKILGGICHTTIELSNTKNRWGAARPTLVFAPSVQCAKEMTNIFNRHHAKHSTGRAASVYTEGVSADERRQIVAAYRQGEIRYLVNYGVFNEGFDAPETRIVVIARVTQSRSAYGQMVGRGTRPDESVVDAINRERFAAGRRRIILESCKPGVLIVDPVGNSGQHKLAIGLTDMLGGWYDDAIVKDAKDHIEEYRHRDDITDVVRELQEAKRRVEEAEESRRKEFIVRVKKYTLTPVDPFNLLDVRGLREPPWFKGKPVTPGQRRVLLKAGVEEKQLDELTLFRAATLIDVIKKRQALGTCTLGQAKILSKYGHDVNLTFAEARTIIDDIASKGWPKPDAAREVVVPPDAKPEPIKEPAPPKQNSFNWSGQ